MDDRHSWWEDAREAEAGEDEEETAAEQNGGDEPIAVDLAEPPIGEPEIEETTIEQPDL